MWTGAAVSGCPRPEPGAVQVVLAMPDWGRAGSSMEATGVPRRVDRGRVGTTPSDYARAVGDDPVFASPTHDWRDVSLQRFDVPRFDLTLGGCCLHRVTLHLRGRVRIERTRDGRRDSEWSSSGCSNVIPAGVPVTRSFEDRADFLVIYLEPRVVDEVAEEVFDLPPARVHLIESLAASDQTLDRFGQLLLAEAEAVGAGTRLFIDTLTRALALHLLRGYCDASKPTLVPVGTLASWRLRRTIDYMHTHLSEDLPLHRLASAAGLSASHFTRAFRTATGLPPHHYLTKLRLMQAQHLLQHTRLPVIEVGLRCGFAQATHFATMFRKVFGISPRSYRANRSLPCLQRDMAVFEQNKINS